MNLVDHIVRQWAFSLKTFGPPNERSIEGIVAHLREELEEVEEHPEDIMEWIDVIILAIDGALRAGHSAQMIVEALAAKQRTNELRKWPDWRTVEAGKPINHIREGRRARPDDPASSP